LTVGSDLSPSSAPIGNGKPKVTVDDLVEKLQLRRQPATQLSAGTGPGAVAKTSNYKMDETMVTLMDRINGSVEPQKGDSAFI
jgi:hypothetical protein